MSDGDHVAVSGKEISVVTEECFAVGDIARWDYIVVNMAGKGAFLMTQLK